MTSEAVASKGPKKAKDLCSREQSSPAQSLLGSRYPESEKLTPAKNHL